MGLLRSVVSCRFLGACVFISQACFTNTVSAQSIATSTAHWDTLSITANGVDVTSSLVWSNQNIEVSHHSLYDDPSNQTSIPPFNIPNTGWASFSDNQNTIVSTASLSGDPNEISVTNTTAYNGRSDTSVIREGNFIAPEAGVYTFSIDFSLAGEVNNTHTETGGGGSSIFANPYALIWYSRSNASGSGSFTFQDNFDVNQIADVNDTFGTASVSGTLSMAQTFARAPISFDAGESIYFYVQVENLTSSYSNEPTPLAHMPIPAALPLMATGLLGLFGIARRKSN